MIYWIKIFQILMNELIFCKCLTKDIQVLVSIFALLISYLNRFDKSYLIHFKCLLNLIYLKYYWYKVIFIFSNCSNGFLSALEFWLHLGEILLSALNQYLNFCTTNYLFRFKSESEILIKWRKSHINHE